MDDIEALTLTVWGESRGEDIAGKIAVAMVVRNRLRQHYRGAKTYVDVCLAHLQFSAWSQEVTAMQKEQELLTGDPQLKHVNDPTLRICWEVARATIAGTLADNTGNANHYFSVIITPPTWAQQQFCTAEIGKHRFYNIA